MGKLGPPYTVRQRSVAVLPGDGLLVLRQTDVGCDAGQLEGAARLVVPLGDLPSRLVDYPQFGSCNGNRNWNCSANGAAGNESAVVAGGLGNSGR